VIELLKTRFIPFAHDNVENPNLTPAEREFLAAFDSGVKACTIGMSAFTADGRKLASGGGYEPGSVRSLLKKALADFKPESVSATVPPRDDAAVASLRRPPEGGLVLYVTWKLIGDCGARYSTPPNKCTRPPLETVWVPPPSISTFSSVLPPPVSDMPITGWRPSAKAGVVAASASAAPATND